MYLWRLKERCCTTLRSMRERWCEWHHLCAGPMDVVVSSLFCCWIGMSGLGGGKDRAAHSTCHNPGQEWCLPPVSLLNTVYDNTFWYEIQKLQNVKNVLGVDRQGINVNILWVREQVMAGQESSAMAELGSVGVWEKAASGTNQGAEWRSVCSWSVITTLVRCCGSAYSTSPWGNKLLLYIMQWW